MTTNKQDEKDKWERKRVQRVLDYHNEKYGTHVEAIDKAINVYPHLRERKRQLHWDWVCRDTETHEEIAVEVKEITKEEVEKRADSIYNVLHEVRKGLSNNLPGVFALSAAIDNNYAFPFKKQPKNKQMFKDVVSKAILESVQKLNVGETIKLLPKISDEFPDDAIAPEAEELLVTTRDELPFELPNTTFFDLRKLSSKGNGLVLWLSIGGSAFILDNFDQMVSHANEQLKKARVKETLLVLVEEGYNPKDPPEIAEAFKNINPESYSEIKHVYFIRGKEVAEIPLPTP